MAVISADGQSFLVNNARVWVVGGVVGYSGVPRSLWAERLRRARAAGLNTVVVPAVWSAHERVPGTFDFEGDNDLGAFIRMAGEAGLWVIVRVGPFVGERLSLGGIPGWVLNKVEADEVLRTASPGFMGAVSSWMGALSREIAPLQAKNAGDRDGDARTAGKAVLAVQVENGWYCGDQELAEAYLGGLTRYLREGGVSSPVVTVNNMYAGVEGAIEAWSGYSSLYTVVRQLHAAWPDDPSLVGEVRAVADPTWGEPTSDAKSPAAVQRALAEVAAGGGQFVIGGFAPGAARGFTSGRQTHAEASWCAAAPSREFVAEDGSVGGSYSAVRRLAMFVDAFGRVFGGAEADRSGAAIDPAATAPAVLDERTGEREKKKPAPGVSVVHLRGSSGGVVFLFGDDTSKSKTAPVLLSLPGGLNVSADMGSLPVSWVLVDVHLEGSRRVDYVTLPALTASGSMLVVFGSAGATGVVSVNGTSAGLKVPGGKTPTVVRVEGATVVVCNEAQADAAFIENGSVYVGADRLDDGGEPIAADGFKTVTVVAADGSTTSAGGADGPALYGGGKKPSLKDWSVATVDDLLSGGSDAFARIDGPATMESLGTPDGYGWYRVAFNRKSGKRTRCGLLGSADRVHAFVNGGKAHVFGDGPGALGRVAPLSLKSGENMMVMLADNLGRNAAGFDLRGEKGVWDEVYEVADVKGAPKVETVSPVDLLSRRSPIEGVHEGDRTHPDRLVWEFTHRKKSPLFLRMDICDWTGALVLNDEVVKVFTPGIPVSFRMDQEILNRGANRLELAIVGDDDEVEKSFAKIKSVSSLLEGTSAMTEGAAWSFAAWGVPAEDAFEPMAKGAMSGAAGKALKGSPCWWRASFDGVDAPRGLTLECKGLSKGQILVNGENVGRYWVATPDGKAVPPQTAWWIPPDVLRADDANELLLFDEHGFAPSKVALKRGPLAG